MKTTVITQENEFFFDAAVGPYWRDRKWDDLFLGVIDETQDDTAVGASVWRRDGDGFDLLFIGVDEARRREGFGTCLVEEAARIGAEEGVDHLSAAFYATRERAESGDHVLIEFLKGAGFDVGTGPVERQVFNFNDVYSLYPLHPEGLPAGWRIIRGSELTSDQLEDMESLVMEQSEQMFYLDPERIASPDNRYGGVLLYKEQVIAAMMVEPFLDGVRVDSLLARVQAMKELQALYDYALQATHAERPMPEKVYIDVGGEKLLAYVNKRFEVRGVPCIERLQGYYALRR